MTENKTEFRKRKKSEKRLQAERQVIDAYSKCIDGMVGETPDDATPMKGFFIDDKFIKWRIRMEPEIEDLYSTIDISKALNMPRERLRDWMVRGFIEPSLPSTSKGTIAIFTRDDVVCVALFQNLIDMGLKRETAAEYIDSFVLAEMVGKLSFIILYLTLDDGKPSIRMVTPRGPSFEFIVNSEGKTFVTDLSRFKTKDGKIDLSDSGWTDDDGNKVPLEGLAASKAEDWDSIQLINIKNIERKVDQALEKLT